MRRLSLALRFALRDLRGGFAGLRVFFACIVIGVAAITGVEAVSQSLLSSFAGQGRILLGGDLAFSRSQRALLGNERGFLAQQGAIAEIASMRAMARAAEDRFSVVELKAVDSAYPLVGALTIAPPSPLDQAFALRDGFYGVLVDGALIEKLALKIGDIVSFSDAPFQLRGEILGEPDKILGGLGFGPRVMISTAALRESGLLKETTLVRWSTRLALNDGTSAFALAQAQDRIMRQFPESGWEARSRVNFSPQLNRNIERFSQFMGLIGLVSLMIGGVGIASAVTAFVERKRQSIAIMKALGASGALAFLSVLIEMMAIALGGAVCGALLGVLAPFIIAWVFGPLIAAPFTPLFSVSAFLLGLGVGLLAALAFVVAPAGRAHDAPVAALFRLSGLGDRPPLRLAYGFGAVAAFCALGAAVYLLSAEKMIALMAMAGIAIAWCILRLIAFLLIIVARHAAPVKYLTRKSLAARLAAKNIHRPGAATVSVATSLGLGLALLVMVVAVDDNIQRHLGQGKPGQTPDFFFLDVQSAQAEDFRRLLERARPGHIIVETPMLRGRIVRVGETRADAMRPPESVSWVLEGDRGLTYAERPPAGSKVIEGQWWPNDYKGPPLVSIEQDIARGLGLKIGDSLSVNVAGKIITANVANMRQVDWRSFGINFVLVFTPITFAQAPHSELFSISAPSGVSQRDVGLVRIIADAFPSVTSVSVRDALETVSDVVEKLSRTFRAASLITLACALLVLGGALATGQRARLYDAIILRTLGAQRKTLIAAYVLEFLALGVATSIFAIFAGALAAFAIVKGVMALDFFVAWPILVAIVVGGGLLTVALGLAATWRILGEKPANALRRL